MKTLFSFFAKPRIPTVEAWATHNAKKATPDDLIAGAIVASFAKDFKHWMFVGDFNQRHTDRPNSFAPTSLSRKIPGKKHITIDFLFRKTTSSDGCSTIYKYKVIGCEVNGIRVTEAAFQYIYKNWQNVVVKVKAAETAAEEARRAMETNEKKWDLAEGLLGFKRDGLGALTVPVQPEGEPA